MEFLNLGWPEILFVLVLAFIVLGPAKITSFAGDLGQWLRKLSRNPNFREVIHTTDEIRNYPRRILDEALLDQPTRLKDPAAGDSPEEKSPPSGP